MKSPHSRRLLGAVSLLSLASAGPVSAEAPAGSPAAQATSSTSPAPPTASTPALPFDARVTREIQLWRKAKPEKEDTVAVPPGRILTVFELKPEQTFEGEKSAVAAVRPHAQSTYYTLLAPLQPVAPGEVMTDAEAAALLFQKVPAANRAWCQRFAERYLLPASAGAGKAGVIIYSASADDACAGYLAVGSGTGKQAKAHAQPRRGPIMSVRVREVAGSPPLMEVVEAVRGKGLSGWRRVLLSVERGTPRELLVVDEELHQLKGDTKDAVFSVVKMTPAGDGLGIEVRRTDAQVVLATGAEKARTESVKSYHYAGGKLTAVKQPAGGK
jgi:hypothetical protein